LSDQVDLQFNLEMALPISFPGSPVPICFHPIKAGSFLTSEPSAAADSSRPQQATRGYTTAEVENGSPIIASKKVSSPQFSKLIFWIGFAVLLVLAIGLLLMPIPFHSQRMKELCDLVHLPLFSLLVWASLTWRTWRDNGIPQRAIWKIALFWLVVGSLLEFSQKFVQRGTSWEDAISNAMGIVVGTCAFLAPRKETGRYRIPFFIFALLLFVFGWGWNWYQLLQT
jgi:uncharacterized membrane protein YhaH (DUF805 family)